MKLSNSSIIVILFSIFLIITPIASVIAINLPKSTNPHDIGSTNNNEVGYIFPNTILKYNGLSMDENNNHIEDFIEHTAPAYSDHKYLDAIVTLTQPFTKKLENSITAIGCKINHVFTVIQGLAVSIPIDKLHYISQLPTIELIQSIHVNKPQLDEGIPLVKASQYNLQQAGYNEITGEDVNIAVIDSGIDGNHHTFKDRIIGFRDFMHNNDDFDTSDGIDSVDYGSYEPATQSLIYHGTMCASCAVGIGGTGYFSGYKGAAPNANLIAITVEDTYDMVRAIEWCINNRNRDFNNDKDEIKDGVDIITLSMGVQGTISYLDNAAGAAMDYGIVFVTSAGNYGPATRTVTSPATSTKVIAVGSIQKNKQISTFSSRGPGPGGIIKPDVVAPGDDLVVAYPGNHWTMADGTSFAGPIVAGVAALILQYDPDLDPYEVKDILLKSADDRGDEGPDNTFGWGIVDAIAALDLVLKVKSLDSTAKGKPVWEDTSVTFTATASGTNVDTYEWDFDNDGIYDLTTNDNSASHTFPDEGDFWIKVRITNSQGKTAEKSIMITVKNFQPDAILEIDGELDYVYEDEYITFNASQSWDTPSDMEHLGFSWSFDNGLNFTNYTKKDRTIRHSFNKTGQYTIIVRVRDDNDEISEKSVTVKVENLIPIADAGGDRTVLEDELIHFSGINTIDSKSDLPLLNFTWDFGDGTERYGMNQSHSYFIEYDNESYYVTLTVTDDDGEKSKTRIEVTVRNQPPVVNVENGKIGFEDDIIEFNGTADDTINDEAKLLFMWKFGDGYYTDWLEDPYVTHIYTTLGTYHPEFLVKDPKGAINSELITVTINNKAPVAKFKSDKTTATEDETIIFNAGDSYDSESDLKKLYYIWDLGDGTISHGKIITHKFYEEKKFSIRLTVVDDDGAESTIKKEVQITNSKPNPKIDIEKHDFMINEQVKVFGYGTTDTPADKLNLTYSWNFGDNTGWEIGGINATHKYSEPGRYKIQLMVEDDDREDDSTSIYINVTSGAEAAEDIYANPTVENNGLIIYAGIGVLIVILILLLISLLMYYRNKKGIFGRFERMLREQQLRREREPIAELAEASDYGDTGGATAYPPTGMTPEQEQFFADLYGVHPRAVQAYMSSQPPPQFPPTPSQKNGDKTTSQMSQPWQPMQMPPQQPGLRPKSSHVPPGSEIQAPPPPLIPPQFPPNMLPPPQTQQQKKSVNQQQKSELKNE